MYKTFHRKNGHRFAKIIVAKPNGKLGDKTLPEGHAVLLPDSVVGRKKTVCVGQCGSVANSLSVFIFSLRSPRTLR
jgi:hypothetical protein